MIFNIRNIKKVLIVIFIFSLCGMLIGCSKINDFEVKMGMKNKDFDYINEGKIQKMIIQNTRDLGFRFTVTDQKAIKELYDILSSAKVVTQKTLLKPDYVFEMYDVQNKVHKFMYIAGIDKKDAGNLYSEDKVYIVSKRIDNDILKSFQNTRNPNDFKGVYYTSIIKSIQEYQKYSDKNLSVGINVDDDIESAKFILSSDLDDFNTTLKQKFSNVELINKDKSVYDVVLTIKTEGYKKNLYKATMTFWNNKEKGEKIIYVWNEFKSDFWNYQISSTKISKF